MKKSTKEQHSSLHSSQAELTLGPEDDDSVHEQSQPGSSGLFKIDLSTSAISPCHHINKPVSQIFLVLTVDISASQIFPLDL